MKQFNVNKLFVIQACLLFYIKCICTYLPKAVVKNGVMYREKREEKREKSNACLVPAFSWLKVHLTPKNFFAKIIRLILWSNLAKKF